MMDFKQITLSDKKNINACLQGNNYRVCDFCFANLWAWRAKFKTHFTIVKETLFLRFEGTSGQLFYLMPVGKMPLQKAFDYIKRDAEENNIPFRMKGITEKMWRQVQQAMPGEFSYIRDRDNDEYIYLSEKLIHLSGKKLQSKRNHINRFKADYPDWHYAPIQTSGDCAECLSLLEEWEQQHNPGGELLSKHDFVAAKNMLDYFNELELTGGMIRVNGRIVAFTIGEALTADTFCVHVEKAADVNGTYAMINQQFIEHEASDFIYINREEDMGLDNLRKAKLSYYPDILLQEGRLES
jgi:hypothetical protein